MKIREVTQTQKEVQRQLRRENKQAKMQRISKNKKRFLKAFEFKKTIKNKNK